MSRIFLCHASEDKPIAETIQLALAGAGHEVFYDEHSLPPGGDYHDRIHSAIKKCDLFVFVASPASTTPGRSTLSEMSFARARWPSPVGQVLPVVIGGLGPQALPAYLQATTVLEPKGNLATEVRQAVQALLASRRRAQRRAKLAFAGLCAVLLSAVGALWYLAARNQPPATTFQRAVEPTQLGLPDQPALGAQGPKGPAETAAAQAKPEAPPSQPCRHESHGVESYAKDFVVERVSPWMGGGYSRDQWCDEVTAALRGEYPASTLEVAGTDESSKNTCPPFNCPQYQYVCKVRVRAEPIYYLRESPACS